MFRKLFLVFILCSYMPRPLYAQVGEILDSLSIYGKFSVHGAVFGNKVEFQENSPKLGAKVHRNINKNLEVFGALEYRYHIIDGTEFNNDAATPSDFINDPFKEIEAFVSRLAYVGLDHNRYGTLSVGKQWGVYYDVAGYTDNFTVFGGSSTGVYAGGTDGGWKGTGRADKSLLYRNSFGGLSLGAQSQFLGEYYNFGVSLQYKWKALEFGLGWNRAQIQKEFRKFISDIGNSTTNVIGAIQYQKEKWTIAAAVAFNGDEFIRLSEEEVISFATTGIEVFTSYRPSNPIEIQVGFNYMTDNKKNIHYQGAYRLFHFIGGLNYHVDDHIFFYSSFRLDNSNLITGAKTENVFLLGFTYNFFKDFN